MTTPAAYLAAQLPPGQAHPTAAQAEAAVAQALADAERYYRLLLKAIRNAKSC